MPDVLKKAFAIGLVAAIGLGIGWLAFGRGGDGQGHASFSARIPPVEFLYLDGIRIANYVAQLEGGQRGAEVQVSKATSSVSGEAGATGFKIGASSQLESSAESTLTRTAASEFGVMLRALRNNTQPGVSVHNVDLAKPADLNRLEEGWLVRFGTDDLLSPGYIRPYVVVRQSATLAALFPVGSPGNEIAALRAGEQKKRAEAFAKRVGPNPRITFAVSPRENSLKILLPMQYKDLTSERSLLEKGQDQLTGGDLVVVGKVIRVFPPSDIPCPPKRDTCVGGRRPFYTDFATREIWRHPIEGASNYLIDHVSHNCVVSNVGSGTIYLGSGRACYLGKLREQTELYPPGAVILPIAVYK